MSSVCRFFSCLVLLLAGSVAFASMPPLRVCASPNNLPFSNDRGQGFENTLARMVAQDLQRDLQFLWLPQQLGQVERALRSYNCDIVMGATAPSELIVLTTPYYRSSYVFVSRKDRAIAVSSLADSSLAKYRIGAHIIGGADAAVPPAEELVRRGLVRNIVGYSIYGHPTRDNPAAELITAVARGEVDMAVAWGPMAGYFAKHSPVPLQVTPICTQDTATTLAFNISMGVRRGDELMLKQVNQIIARRQKEIQDLLSSYGVPLLSLSQNRAECR